MLRSSTTQPAAPLNLGTDLSLCYEPRWDEFQVPVLLRERTCAWRDVVFAGRRIGAVISQPGAQLGVLVLASPGVLRTLH